MDRITAFNPREEEIQGWLARFELWLRLENKPDDTRAGWCRLLIGPHVASTLRLAKDDATYPEIKTLLIAQLGDPSPIDTATRQLSSLTKESLSCKELARQATHLARTAFMGAPDTIIERQALEAFLRALPVSLRREVLRVDRHTLEDACREAERQEVLMKEDPPEGAAAVLPGDVDDIQAVQAFTGARNKNFARDYSNFKCYGCNQMGHIRRFCPNRKPRKAVKGETGPGMTDDEVKALMKRFFALLQPPAPPERANLLALPPPVSERTVSLDDSSTESEKSESLNL